MDVPVFVWAAVVVAIVSLLLLDLLLFHRTAHEVTTKEAALSTAFWVSIGLSFAVLIAVVWGPTYAGEYLAGYLVEESLSVDNIFVFALLLTYFAVPPSKTHRVLFWGVLGAIVFRAIFIAAGAALLGRFSWMIYVFGAFLVFTGIKMLRHDDAQVDPERNPFLKLMRRLAPNAPLLPVIVAIETTDILFAVDSIPAVFAVTDEPFIVFTSNAFAILGLRAIYFLLARMMHRFAYLKVGLAAVLVFVGAKMLLADVFHIPVFASLLAIATMLTTSVVASLRVEPEPIESTTAP